MTTEATTIALVAYLDALGEEASRVEALAESLIAESGDARLSEALSAVLATSRSHAAALGSRRKKLSLVAPPETGDTGPAIDLLLARLAGLYSTLQGAAFGYAILHVLAHRVYDSTGEDNTADLAEVQLKESLSAAQTLLQLVSHAAVTTHEAAGGECACACPSCSLGICVCARHGAETVARACQDTQLPQPSGPIEMRRPRAASPAAEAGLREGDLIASADGREIGRYADLQTAVRAASPGAEVHLSGARGSESGLQVVIRKP